MTDSHHRFRKHANLVQDAPTPAAPNRRSVRASPSLPPRQGTGHLRLVTKACSRRIAGHHLHASLPPDGCPEALARAVRGAGTAAPGSVHASKRGSQYCSAASQAARRAAGLRCSRSDGYACYPNARAERGNGILKADVLLLPDDLAQARLLVEQAVHRSNEERPPLSLKYLPPQVHAQGKPPPENPGAGLALFLSTDSRTGHFCISIGSSRPVKSNKFTLGFCYQRATSSLISHAR